MGIVIGKAETGTGSLKLIVGPYGIFQSTGLSHNGNRTIAQAHQLA